MPATITNETDLDDLLSTPRRETVAAFDACPGDIVIEEVAGRRATETQGGCEQQTPPQEAVITFGAPASL
jgi:hypothetical protein